MLPNEMRMKGAAEAQDHIPHFGRPFVIKLQLDETVPNAGICRRCGMRHDYLTADHKYLVFKPEDFYDFHPPFAIAEAVWLDSVDEGEIEDLPQQTYREWHLARQARKLAELEAEAVDDDERSEIARIRVENEAFAAGGEVQKNGLVHLHDGEYLA